MNDYRVRTLHRLLTERACVWVTLCARVAWAPCLLLIAGCALPPELPDQCGVTFDVAPGGATVVFTSGNQTANSIYALDLRTRTVTVLVPSKSPLLDPAMSPDGKSMVYLEPTESMRRLVLWDLRSGTGKPLTDTPGVLDTSPAFAEGGKQVVFRRAMHRKRGGMGGLRWCDWSLWAVRTDGTEERCLVPPEPYHTMSAPGVSPDGLQVLFFADPYSDDGVRRTAYVLSLSGSLSLRTLGHIGDWAGRPAYVFDGSEVVFPAQRGPFWVSRTRLWRMRADGADIRLATQHVREWSAVRAVPGRPKVLALMDSGAPRTRYNLVEVDLTTGETKLVADSTLFDDPLNWKPNAQKEDDE